MNSIYVNKAKAKTMISNFTHKEHKVYEAHTINQHGFQEYVDLDSFNEFKIALARIANDNLSAKDAEKIATSVMKRVLT